MLKGIFYRFVLVAQAIAPATTVDYVRDHNNNETTTTAIRKSTSIRYAIDGCSKDDCAKEYKIGDQLGA